MAEHSSRTEWKQCKLRNLSYGCPLYRGLIQGSRPAEVCCGRHNRARKAFGSSRKGFDSSATEGRRGLLHAPEWPLAGTECGCDELQSAPREGTIMFNKFLTGKLHRVFRRSNKAILSVGLATGLLIAVACQGNAQTVDVSREDSGNSQISVRDKNSDYRSLTGFSSGSCFQQITESEKEYLDEFIQLIVSVRLVHEEFDALRSEAANSLVLLLNDDWQLKMSLVLFSFESNAQAIHNITSIPSSVRHIQNDLEKMADSYDIIAAQFEIGMYDLNTDAFTNAINASENAVDLLSSAIMKVESQFC